MRLRTFNAATMNDAMLMIRTSMGDEAVIISSGPDPMGRGVNVTVATDEVTLPATQTPNPHTETPQAFVPLFARDIPQKISREAMLGEIEKILEFHSIPGYLVSKLLQTGQYIHFDLAVTREGVRSALQKILEAHFRFMPLHLDASGYRLMLVGAPGIGKTLAVAKMAAQLVMDKHAVTVVTTDNMRAGGVEQLSAFTSILGIELQIAGSKSELRKILASTPPMARVLIDSAGTNPYDSEQMHELAELSRLEGIEAVFAIAAGMDSKEAEDIAQAFMVTGARRLLVTRADTARRLGNIMAAANVANLAFCNVSSTSRVVGKFAPLDSDALTNLLMQHRS